MLDGLKIFSTTWGGTPPVMQTEELVNNYKRLHISFFVPTQGVDYQYLPIGVPHPMVMRTCVV
jgi:hypothetical protein